MDPGVSDSLPSLELVKQHGNAARCVTSPNDVVFLVS